MDPEASRGLCRSLHGLIWQWTGDQDRVGTRDRQFLTCDRPDVLPQILGVVDADRRDDAYLGIDHVRGVESSPETHLDDRGVDGLIRKEGESGGSRQFEIGIRI